MLNQLGVLADARGQRGVARVECGEGQIGGGIVELTSPSTQAYGLLIEIKRSII